MKNTLIAAALLLTLTALAACNTMEGIGEDIEAAGETISGSAKDTKEKM